MPADFVCCMKAYKAQQNGLHGCIAAHARILSPSPVKVSRHEQLLTVHWSNLRQ